MKNTISPKFAYKVRMDRTLYHGNYFYICEETPENYYIWRKSNPYASDAVLVFDWLNGENKK